MSDIAVKRLHLTDVSPAPSLPWSRPSFPVYAYLVLHPAGPILIDTGVGIGNGLIDELYSPVHHDLDHALGRYGVRAEAIGTVITSHLHFDHCGQNDRFAHARIVVQQHEIEAAKAPHYTVPEWAFPPGIDLMAIDGDYELVDGVRVIVTPGHSPGHQSVLVEEGDGTRTIVCCQASWSAISFDAVSLGDDGWNEAAGVRSLRRLHSLRPDRVLMSHDPNAWSAPG